MEYSQSGNYVALAGLVVAILSRFGISTTIEDAGLAISGVLVIIGVVKQIIHNRKVALAGGFHPSQK